MSRQALVGGDRSSGGAGEWVVGVGDGGGRGRINYGTFPQRYNNTSPSGRS